MTEDDQNRLYSDIPRENEDSSIEGTEANSELREATGGSRKKRWMNLDKNRTPFQVWLISYSDFMTILTIFFLAMYGYTYLDAASLLFPKQQSISYSAFSDLVRKLQGEMGEGVKVQNHVNKVTIELSEKILFPSGSPELNMTADQALKALAKSLKLVEGDIIVQGHTDNVPVSGGRFHSNWELSAARAFSVIQALTAYGVPAERLAAWGFGQHRPIGSNDTTEEKRQNRRIEIVVLKVKESGV